LTRFRNVAAYVRGVSSRPTVGARPTGPVAVFELDLEHCPNCGGELKIIAAAGVPVVQRTRMHRSGRFVQGQPFRR